MDKLRMLNFLFNKKLLIHSPFYGKDFSSTLKKKKKSFFSIPRKSNQVMLRKNLFLATKKKTLSNQIKKKVKICRGVWFVFLNNYFQFLNNILRIFIHFFYPYTFSQIFSNNNL